jgi:hypothetical protein
MNNIMTNNNQLKEETINDSNKCFNSEKSDWNSVGMQGGLQNISNVASRTNSNNYIGNCYV